jgi:HK97 family phage major capsid protein
MDRNLSQVLGELQKLQAEYKGKPMPENVGTQFATLAAEAKSLQDASDRSRTIQQVEEAERKSRVIPEVALPATEAKSSSRFEGMLSLGDFVAASEELKRFVDAGMPRTHWGLVEVPVRGGKGSRHMVGLTKTAMNAIEQKSPPTIADRVIPYFRDTDLVLSEEYVAPTLLSVMNIVQTNAGTVEWVRRNSRTRGAATQDQTITEGVQGLKGEATNAYQLVTTPIRTHAVWQPVTEQQLADWPALASFIDADLSDDMNQYLEEQILYGDGTGTNFDGFFEGSNVTAAREVAEDTIIDVIRRGITDIRRNQFTPNAIVMDPIDWESAVLAKGTDDRYVWTVVTEAGVPRIWGLPVVETPKAEGPDGVRNVLIGDFTRGATLYDRMTRTVSVGLIDDQFVRNMRTILMEARAGFAIRRPGAFRKIETAAGESA